MVGKEVVEGSNKISALQEGAGETAPLKAKGNFEQSPHLPAVRRQLGAIRAKHGPKTSAGRRCSNLLVQLKNYQTSTMEQRVHLEKSIAASVAELSAQNADTRQPIEKIGDGQ